MSVPSRGIILESSHWDQMMVDVATRSGEEACGFVLGEGGHSWRVIPITNILHDTARFRMDPQEQLDSFLLADELGLDILAVYHSHPHGIDHPSVTDVAELTFPGIIYLIWFQAADEWQCCAYLMQSESEIFEVPLTISTNL